ncbi:MAG TPA: hypothetical protein VIY28_19455 [Pseudonocardiaceae bacterium]
MTVSPRTGRFSAQRRFDYGRLISVFDRCTIGASATPDPFGAHLVVYLGRCGTG